MNIGSIGGQIKSSLKALGSTVKFLAGLNKEVDVGKLKERTGTSPLQLASKHLSAMKTYYENKSSLQETKSSAQKTIDDMRLNPSGEKIFQEISKQPTESTDRDFLRDHFSEVIEMKTAMSQVDSTGKQLEQIKSTKKEVLNGQVDNDRHLFESIRDQIEIDEKFGPMTSLKNLDPVDIDALKRMMTNEFSFYSPQDQREALDLVLNLPKHLLQQMYRDEANVIFDGLASINSMIKSRNDLISMLGSEKSVPLKEFLEVCVSAHEAGDNFKQLSGVASQDSSLKPLLSLAKLPYSGSNERVLEGLNAFEEKGDFDNFSFLQSLNYLDKIDDSGLKLIAEQFVIDDSPFEINLFMRKDVLKAYEAFNLDPDKKDAFVNQLKLLREEVIRFQKGDVLG